MKLTEYETQPKIGVRPKHSAAVWFVFGDASGKCFGVSLWVAGTDGIDVCFGTWAQDVSKESSNYREFLNLVLRIEKLSKQGLIAKRTEIFIFTDNWVTEQCFSHP
jgi:hypothetical protein